MLDIDFKEKWIEALESGRYLQGHGQLRTYDNKFCCLGVGADILNPSGWNETVEGWRHDRQACLMASDLANSVGLDMKVQAELSGKNDLGDSFETIANYIREKL